MLKLTKKADYGLIALRHLAMCRPSRSASAKEIADCYGVPLPLLSKVLQKLARSGLLTAIPGANGGYMLARDPREINALEVIRTIEGPIILTSCFTAGGCGHSTRCGVREPLRRIHDGILQLLEGITISEMSEEAAAKPAKLAAIETL